MRFCLTDKLRYCWGLIYHREIMRTSKTGAMSMGLKSTKHTGNHLVTDDKIIC